MLNKNVKTVVISFCSTKKVARKKPVRKVPIFWNFGVPY